TQRPRAGTLFLAYGAVASLANFVLGFQRGDETAYVGALRIDQIVDAAVGVLALTAWLWRSGLFSRTRIAADEGNVG
ncbi:MAG: hypothetical protein KGJ80_16545, partial [Chloroflexota bacterium]|nr:hypothetical protein [Chloroflexota bacterium]